MNFDSFLQNKLNTLFDYKVTPDEEKAIKLGQIKDVIFRRLISNKLTKNNLKEESKKLLFQKISDTVDNNEPLYLIFCFGGYKNHWVKEYHPNVEWAEVFNLIYVSKLLAPISKIYTPGIIYEFEAEDDAVVAEDNYFRSDIDAYADSFKSLISYFNDNYIPSNFKFRYKRLGEQYDTNTFFEKLKPLIKTRFDEFKSLPIEELDRKIKRSMFNFKVKGNVDYSNLSEEELRDKYIESLAINSAFLEEDFNMRGDYFIGGNHIPLIGAYCTDEENTDNWICINSVANRDNAFWTSRGIVIKSNNDYKFDILTPSNYEKIESKLVKEPSSILTSVLPYLDSILVLNF